jgi:hypothetical protein
MSTPVRGPEGDDNRDKFLLYAPRWVRENATNPPPPPPPRAIAQDMAHAPPMAPGIGGPNIVPPPMAPGVGRRNMAEPLPAPDARRRNIFAPPVAPELSNADAPPLPARFEGDVAMEALRRRLALDPQPVPEPPIQLRRGNRLAWIGRLFAMCVVAALGAFGLTWMTSRQAPVATDQNLELVELTRPVPTRTARGATPAPVRLLVESQRGDVNEPLALGVSLDGKVSGETLLVAGFAEGTRLSVGAPLGRTGWHLSALDLGNAMAYAPPDFVGAMEARVDLRAYERVLDSQVLRLEWVPKQPEAQTAAVSPAEAAPPQPLAPDEIAGLLKRGEEFLRTGDIASARLLLRRAANAGNADAALALGGTYDGAVLAKLGVLGFARNADQARLWYQKAAELGSQIAEQRLQTLGRAGN